MSLEENTSYTDSALVGRGLQLQGGNTLFFLLLNFLFRVLQSHLLSMSLHFPVLLRLIVNHCDCGLSKWWGQQEFAIPQNVLEIVYGQTICWIGTFYCPMLPAICTLKYFFMFYIKKVIFVSNIYICMVKTRNTAFDNLFPFSVLFKGIADN